VTPEQTTALIAAIATLATALTGLLGAVVVLFQRVEANRKAIDGRVDQLISTARIAGHAEGIVLGKELEKRDGDRQQ